MDKFLANLPQKGAAGFTKCAPGECVLMPTGQLGNQTCYVATTEPQAPAPQTIVTEKPPKVLNAELHKTWDNWRPRVRKGKKLERPKKRQRVEGPASSSEPSGAQ